MSTCKDVRAALEKIRGCDKRLNPKHICHHGCHRDPTEVESALVSEGLAACDEYEKHFSLGPGPRGQRHGDSCWDGAGDCADLDLQMNFLDSILRKAGLLK